jgi:hypothetical protein
MKATDGKLNPPKQKADEIQIPHARSPWSLLAHRYSTVPPPLIISDDVVHHPPAQRRIRVVHQSEPAVRPIILTLTKIWSLGNIEF